MGLWLDVCFTNFLDFNCGGYYNGYYDRSLSRRARGVLPFVFTFIRRRRTWATMGDPEHCREMDDSPDDLGVANAWDSSGERGAFGGEPSRGA